MAEKHPPPAVDASGGEEALVASRRTKAEQVRSRGDNPFANDVDAADRAKVHSLREQFTPALIDSAELRYDPEKVAAIAGDEPVHVFGRVMARRGFGKASFLSLRDGTGDIQLFAKKDILGAAFAVLDDLDVGDHVEARGRMMVTKTGELSVELRHLRLLTKALRPLPDKWHGLTDVEMRYRRRYVDLIANPDSAFVLRARSILIRAVRDYLDGLGFLEVETPTLHSLVGGAAARPFSTHHNTLDLDLFLRIAPELYLKRLLVGGLERVYEIGRCYRNEGISTRHNPEFTILEFYQAYATYETLMPMVEAMIRHVDAFTARELDAIGLGGRYAELVAERAFTLDEPFARVTLREALRGSAARAELPEDFVDRLDRLAENPGLVAELRPRSPRAERIEWDNLVRGLKASPTAGDRTFVAYEYVAEPFLPEDYRSQDGSRSRPVFIMDYPFETSPLARRKDSDPSLVDRFEMFIEGKELCNAFSELNDPEDQAARFRDQVERKQRGDAETMDYDEDYVRALQHGMPPAAGFGMGIDRLAMFLLGQPSIRDVIAFPLLRPEAGPSS